MKFYIETKNNDADWEKKFIVVKVIMRKINHIQ